MWKQGFSMLQFDELKQKCMCYYVSECSSESKMNMNITSLGS